MTINLGLLLALLTLLPTSNRKRHTVSMSAFQYSPVVLHASVGDTVVWENRDIVPHTADADSGAWKSGDIPAKGKRMTVVRRKGEQPFTCLYHSNMKGKLVVK